MGSFRPTPALVLSRQVLELLLPKLGLASHFVPFGLDLLDLLLRGLPFELGLLTGLLNFFEPLSDQIGAAARTDACGLFNGPDHLLQLLTGHFVTGMRFDR